MGTAAEKPEVWVVTTGFGPFGRVSVNPTDLIMQELQKSERLRGLNAKLNEISRGSKVILCRTLEVSINATAAALDEIRAEVAKRLATAPSSRAVKVLYIHFGVDEGASGFLLESKAYNEADFAADMQGRRAVREKITEDKSLDFCFTSSFALNEVARHARDSGYPCDVSMDAGRYLCNYVYFSSFLRCESPNEKALFIHAPPQVRVPMGQQVDFACFIIAQLVAKS